MTILITGSLGKTSSRLAAILHSEGRPILVASRTGKAGSYPAVRFDFTDESTYELPFTSPEAQKQPISAVYLARPPVEEPATPLIAFIDFARARGVKRFVYLSASPDYNIDPSYGASFAKPQDYLKQLEKQEVEWAAVRPTWFMQNMSEEQYWHPVKEQSRVISAAGNGKIPFIAAEDIAAVAARGLTDETPHNTDHIILGPELMTYDDVANVLTDVIGRKITHTKLSQQELVDWLISRGLPANVSNMLAELDIKIGKGMEERLNDTVLKVTGRSPMTFREYAEKNKEAWI